MEIQTHTHTHLPGTQHAPLAPTVLDPRHPSNALTVPIVMSGSISETRARAYAVPFRLWLVALTFAAFAARALLANTNSAFMDEGTFAINGRMLIDSHTNYAGYLNWAYGSYLWTILVGFADMVGGVLAMRLLTSVLGAMMVLATALTVRALAPPHISPTRRDVAALIAGGLMAVLPTTVAVGRFATYDPLAGAALMGCVAVLAITWRKGSRRALLAAAALLFISFLSKYVVAVYVPVICLWMMIVPLIAKPQQTARFVRNLCWFVLPLCVVFAGYAFIFRNELLQLLIFSKTYTDLKSSDAFQLYVIQRLDLWALVVTAPFGLRRISTPGRWMSLIGAATIVAFQAASRPDADWWKHSIYLIFFLAPLVGFALAPIVERLLPQTHSARLGIGRAFTVLLVIGIVLPLAGFTLMYLSAQHDFAPWRRVSVSLLLLVLVPAGLILAPLGELILEERGKRVPQGLWRSLVAVSLIGIVIPVALATSFREANRVATDYPNLQSSVAAIRTESAHARRILTDDSVIRYYLYGQDPNTSVATRIYDPFSVSYRGLEGMEAYRKMVTDRYADVIIFDGGVGPIGQQLHTQLADLIPQYYDRVYERQEPAGTVIHPSGTLVQIYRARAIVPTQSGPVPPNATVYQFDNGAESWGARTDAVTPGVGVTMNTSQRWNDHASLQFMPNAQTQTIGARQDAPVSRVRAQVYIEPKNNSTPDIVLGMVGFDEQWQWRDDGFKQSVSPGRWVEVSWTLSQPGVYHEVDLMFLGAENIKAVYLGQVEVDP